MVHRDWTSMDGKDGRFGTPVNLVPAPVASPGIRDALRDAFACEKSSTTEFDRLLAKIR